MCALDLTQVLMECLFKDFNFRGSQVEAAMLDVASVNGAALEHLVFMPNFFDVKKW